jgi:putative molybdopterin biosynthesis protein
MSMTIYLNDIPLSEAWDRFNKILQTAGLATVFSSEIISLDEQAVGRVVAKPIWAQISSPHYHASAMDGFTVHADKSSSASTSNPLVFHVKVDAFYVDTGDPIPEGFDAVIPVEDVEPLDDRGKQISSMAKAQQIRIHAAVTPWSHIRPMGEDMVATQLVLPQGHILRPVDLGALAASGSVVVEVVRKPKVGIIPTGTELIQVGIEIAAGSIIEFNSIVLAAQVNGWGGQAYRYPIVKDNFEDLANTAALAASENDLVLINAGSSAGSEDFTAQVVEKLGEMVVHGIAVRPGHPVILGTIQEEGGRRKVPVIGVPGYPVSAAMTGEIFIKPLLQKWLGSEVVEPMELEATLTRKINSPAGDDDYVRMVVGQVGSKLLAAPLAKGAGVITSLVRADGITIIPRGIQGISAGEKVKVKLNQASPQFDRTIFFTGSHDMTLDLLAQFLAQKGRRLISVNVGSQGGLIALLRGEAHAAGSHLLDPLSGEYNIQAIKEYIPNLPVRVMEWVKREQGLIVRRGNPKGIRGIKDLTRTEVTFINRQRGAGTRVLLDYHLSKLKIPIEEVKGYSQEEYTHLAVAAAVASGRVDCGLGIAAAASALHLDFVPLDYERYDLVIPLEFAKSGLLAPLFEISQNKEFRAEVNKMPGYDTQDMGKIILET